MANLFSAIALRANGQRILHGWFDALRLAGVDIENYLGAGYIAETSVSLANNASAADVTGLIVDKSLYRSAFVHVEVRRKTDSNEAVAVGMLNLLYKVNTDAWEVIPVLNGDGEEDGAGTIFSITSAGQVRAATDNMSGSNYVGTIKFKSMTFSA